MTSDATLARILRESLQMDRREQHGVVSWQQLREGGWSEGEIRTTVRRHQLVRVHPRVYVDHTGPLTPEQRAWAAVLWAAPAALCGDSALGVAQDAPEVHVAIDHARGLRAPDGVVLHRVTDLSPLIRGGSRPPRLALEHNALVTIRAARSEAEVVAALVAAIGRRGTTAVSMRTALTHHPKLPRVALVRALLDDIEQGTESVLEHGFLVRVERPHGLPAPTRQVIRRDGAERRDMEFAPYQLVVELDGRLNHASWQAGNRDAGRDLADLAGGRSVLRLRWTQVMEQACETAWLLGAALQTRGWTGAPVPCGQACPIT